MNTNLLIIYIRNSRDIYALIVIISGAVMAPGYFLLFIIHPLKLCIMTTYIIESPNGETHKLEVFRTATGFSAYVDGSNICESITEEDFLQELENPTF